MTTQDVLTKTVRKSIEVCRDVPPRSRNELKKYLKEFADVRVPDRRVCGHHAAPMDYLWYAYSRDLNVKRRATLSPAAQVLPLQKGESLKKNARSMTVAALNGDCIVWANRAGGKTQLAAIATLLEGLFKPGCQTRILAGSLSQSGRMYGYLCDFVEGRFFEHLDGKLLKESCRFKNGAAVELLSQSSRAVRGQHVQKLRCDEIELFDESVFNASKFITQSAGQVAAMEMLSTMHRPYGLMQKLIDEAIVNRTPIFKWCLWEVIERCTGDRSCSRCALHEDCQEKARRARGYLKIDDVITQMARSSRMGFESEMLCLRPNLENAVFGDFDEAVHIKPVRYDASLPLYRAIDFGFVNPFVCLWIQVDAAGAVRVFDEYVQDKRVIAEHAAAVKLRTPCGEEQVVETFCDPSGRNRNGVTGTSEVKVLRDSGMRVSFCNSEILAGIEMVRAALKAGDGVSRMVISPKCRRLIKAMRCYHYPDAGSKAGSELPEKDGVHDHLIDALRYFFVNYDRNDNGSFVNY